ncbi:hypothetical protein D9M72_641820 [compost metagenome]
MLVVQQNSSVAIKADNGAISTTYAVTSADYNSSHHLAFFHFTARNCFLDGYFDDVTDTSVTTMGATQHLDAHNAASAAVIGHIEHGLSLNHIISPTPSP